MEAIVGVKLRVWSDRDHYTYHWFPFLGSFKTDKMKFRYLYAISPHFLSFSDIKRKLFKCRCQVTTFQMITIFSEEKCCTLSIYVPLMTANHIRKKQHLSFEDKKPSPVLKYKGRKNVLLHYSSIYSKKRKNEVISVAWSSLSTLFAKLLFYFLLGHTVKLNLPINR